MKHNFKSLHQSNIVFVFNPAGFIMPENSKLTELFSGESGSGARFVDDPVIQSKFLNIPKLQMRMAVESSRFRLDDDSKLPPDETRLVSEAERIYTQLFTNSPLQAFGFNFDFFYRFPEMIPAEYLFKTIVSETLIKKATLKDIGLQFALEKDGGKVQEVYFLKITGPTEIAVHYNYHSAARELPKIEKLKQLFSQAYTTPDIFVEALKF